MRTPRLSLVLVASAVLVCFAATSLPTAEAAPQRTPEGCLVVAFTHDPPTAHYSLLGNGSLVIGTEVTLMTDCEGGLEWSVNGGPRFGTSSDAASLSLTPGGPQTLEVWVGGSHAATWSNMTVWSGSSFEGYVLDGVPPDWSDGLWLTADDLEQREVMVSLGTGLLVWSVVTFVLFRLVRSWVDHHHVEEVVA